MAITTRQTSLLALQDWTKLYQTFRNADFQSYDFETLRKSMIDYLRLYYPEDFNDFTESSEYIALIDLIAFMGQSLAFRADMNARENFIDTAERRDSIMKLAKLVSYNPKRSMPAQGFLKIDSISTSENVFDSDGINLSNLSIFWNDVSNDNWYEQFTAVINAALVNSQVISKPGNSKKINGIQTDEYAVALQSAALPVFSFTKSVEGMNMRFEAVNMTSAGKDYLYEQPPRPNGRFNILYRTDNLGNSSNNTGFFLYFKQGQLKNQDFNISESLPNRTVSIETENINNVDTWLYTLDANNDPDYQWTQVTAVGTNVIYNQNKSTRDLFQVNTKLNDQVDLVFGDGSFSSIPQGKFRFYYRVSNGLAYKIAPSELQGVSIDIGYVSRSGRIETLSIKCSLKQTITNATAKDTIDEIRTKAPQQYYTQNRMVTGEDYNTFPYTNFTNIVKAKAVNRSSSGISRYLDVLDVTGKYSSTNVFANDGILYRDLVDNSFKISFESSREIGMFLNNTLNPLLGDRSVMHLYYESAARQTLLGYYWGLNTVGSGYTSGYILNNRLEYQTTGVTGSNGLQYVRVGSLLKMRAPSGYYFDANNRVTAGIPSRDHDRTSLYASVTQVAGQLITLSVPIYSTPSTRPELVSVVPVFKTKWTSSFQNVIGEHIAAMRSFGITYNSSSMTWSIIQYSHVNKGVFDIASQGSSSDSSWYILLEYNTTDRNYLVTYRNLNFVFESLRETRFFYDPKMKVYDSSTGLVLRDHINILKSNNRPNPVAITSVDGDIETTYYQYFSLDRDQKFYIHKNVTQPDGWQDTTKILLTFPDENWDDVPDDPDVFENVVGTGGTTNSNQKNIYFRRVDNDDTFIKWVPLASGVVVDKFLTPRAIRLGMNDYDPGQVFYATEDKTFWILKITNGALYIVETDGYKMAVGRNGLRFQYRHNSANHHRIDPSPNNIIDLYLLTKSYSADYYAWIRDASNRLVEPSVPTTEELKLEFGSGENSLENYKAISDTLVFNSVTFKPIIGGKADPALRAKIKVVKNSNVTISDNDIKSSVITVINTYFDISNWEFGESFYFSELATYIHTALSPNVASVMIVPSDANQVFGSLYQINAEANEIIVSCATVDDVEIINSVTLSQLNAK